LGLYGIRESCNSRRPIVAFNEACRKPGISMSRRNSKYFDPMSTLAVVMGGGQGARLFPLTRYRAKPAVPIAGKYRLVDIPISNCINSEIKRVYLLTQFNSASLHRHISQSYKFDQFTHGFVEILAAEQTLSDSSWYQGTADAVRKHLAHFLNHRFDYFLILSGDQLYNMNFRKVIEQHIETKAELTVATIPVQRENVSGFGIMKIDDEHRITEFVEKPKEAAVIESLRMPAATKEQLGEDPHTDLYLASMGIYVFNRDVLVELLDNDLTDFGKHIIPMALEKLRACSYVYQGYWEDVGTIRTFFEANLDAASVLPKFNFFDMTAPIFTRPRYLPASKINGAAIEHAVLSDGCIINRARISESIIGVRCIVGDGTILKRTVVMGADYYESEDSIRHHQKAKTPPIGIGSFTRVENAIIDKNARIGDRCIISPEGKPDHHDDPEKRFYIRDGIVVIPKNGILPHGTVI
jgi:glucose-1-phosphate adenylyltransferase